MSHPGFRPLNPSLYRRLCDLFGERGVRVSSAGVHLAEASELAMSVREVSLFGRKQAASSSSPLRARTRVFQRGEYYHVDCPYCSDSKQRLFISYMWPERPDLAWCYNDTHCMEKEEYRLHLRMQILGSHGPIRCDIVRETPSSSPRTAEVPPPGPVIPIHEYVHEYGDSLALEYVRDRGFDPEALWEHYGIGVVDRADRDEWAGVEGRIYIPLRQDNILMGWQARWPEDLDWKIPGSPRKYYNMPGSPVGQILYNWDKANTYQDIVLVEGPMDVWWLGPQSMGLLTDKLSPAKRERLLARRERGSVAVATDGEAYANAEAICESLRGAFHDRVFPVRLPYGRSPARLDREWVWKQILEEAKARRVAFQRVSA